MVSEKHQKVWRLLIFKHFLVFVSAANSCVAISAFTSLVGGPVGIVSSAVEIKICAITSEIESYKSIIKKKKKRDDKIVLLEKAKLGTIKVLISKALVHSYISS